MLGDPLLCQTAKATLAARGAGVGRERQACEQTATHRRAEVALGSDRGFG
jgi:hypothetical protein